MATPVSVAAGAQGIAAASTTSTSLSSPACSTAVTTGPLLSRVSTATTTVAHTPFGIAVTPNGRWAFAALGNSVEVLRIGRSLAPVRVRQVSVPAADDGLAGVTLTGGGRYLLIATSSGAAVVDVARLESGAPGAVLGTLTAPESFGAIEVSVSPGNRYAFVSEEDSASIAVFNLAQALAHGFTKADYVGSIPVGIAPVGLAISPDGRWLYATSEISKLTAGETGTLSVINLARAQTHPATSVVATVDAGCNPVRVITSANGAIVWVTARASDDLLAFSADRLRTDPAHALLAITRVGELPVGLIMVSNGSRIIVADSNRFDVKGASANLDVVNVAAALRGRPAVIGHIKSGLFPREMALEPGGRTLLVGNYLSGTIESVDICTVP
jgi:DNA-binding beta-propeller fold protein YncE